MNKKMDRKFWPLAGGCIVAMLALTPAALHAGGFQLPNQDPEAIGRGNAFAATADDPAAIYYNPAGISQLPGFQASVGLYAISARTSFSSPAGSAHTDPSPQFVPQIYATYALTNLPISFGLGIYAPYGLGLDWGAAAPFNTVAEKGELQYLTANPVVAWRICKTLSIAGGVTLNYSDAEFQKQIPGSSGQFKFNGGGYATGANAGILWQPLPMWSFGANYHSETTITYGGPSSQTTGLTFFPGTVYTTTKIRFPQYAVAGISFRPTPKWNFEFDLNWAQWSAVKKVDFQDTPFGPQSITLDYRNSFMYNAGATRQLGKGYYASVGYIYSQCCSPNQNFNPLIPDANLQLGNLGFGHHGKHWDWALAYQFAYNGGHDVSGDSNATADGTYKTFNNALNGSVTFKF